MINSIADKATQDIYDGLNSKEARKIPRHLHESARRKLDMLRRANTASDLRMPPGNHLEILKDNLKGYYSIRINNQYRIIFKWIEDNAEDVKITDYH